MLAFLPEERAKTIIDEIQFKQYTKKTITDKGELYRELGKISERGYAVDDEEYLEGSVCFAFPLFNEKSEIVAAMSVSGLTSTVRGKETEIITTGLRCSKQCSIDMGWQR